ncbi:MAG: hypothetical protein JST54_05205 [Deltaproteobacteria bacterium]|nr:hypothetical protein [Deltaproteobacteria bacterium]
MTTATPTAAADPRARLQAFLAELKTPLLFALGCGVVLAVFAGSRFGHQSKAPHFVYQAMAFLQGKLELAVRPPNNEDWVLLNGKWYSSFPAFPALVMVPLVAINGYQFNDTSFTVIVAALNLVFLFLALRELTKSGDSARSERDNLILCALMCFGTLYFYCAIRGEVWFTAEVMGVGLTSLYVLFAQRARRPALAGLAYAAGTLTRTPIMFSVVFFLCELFIPSGRLADISKKVEPATRREQFIKLGQFVAGALPLALWHAWMNWARFGSPGDFGHAHLFNNRVNADIEQWGLFHPHYLARNIVAAFLLMPKFAQSQLTYNPHGLSLLLTTPLFVLALFPAAAKGRKDRAIVALALAAAAVAIPWLFDQTTQPRSPYEAPGFGVSAYFIFLLVAGRLVWMAFSSNDDKAEPPRLQLALAVTIAAMALPGLFYQNDGYVQFGFRFSLDWTPYLILLLAVGRRKMDALWWSLAAVGIAVNVWGAVAFRGYSDMFR